MDLLRPFRAVKEKVRKKVEQYQDDQEQVELISYWKKQFDADRRDKAVWDERFDTWEAMYNGNREFENVANRLYTANKEVRTIINFPRMVVESLIDINVPDPEFKPVARDDEQAIESLKNYVKYVVRAANPSLEEINLQEERRVTKYGGGFIKVHWNNTIKRAGYVGDIEFSNPHPKDIIPNHGATNMEDLEHYHHPVNRTVKYILRKWPDITHEDLENKAILYREFDELIDDSKRINTTHDEEGSRESGLNKYTIIETTYKDKDGDICKLWWSGDLLIKHIPKFFYRRDEEGNPTDKEKLEEDLQVRIGIDPETGEELYDTIPAYIEQDTGEVDEFGLPIAEMVQNEVEYYIPKCWDIIYWPFIPRDKCWWGISIMEDVWDIQEAIKKAIYIHEEKHLRGTKKIICESEEDRQKISDPLSEVIVIRNPATVKDIDFGNDIDGIQWVNQLKEWMQLLTGTTDSALGVHNPGVTSGKQAQAYIEQANYKIALKSAYKAAAYKQLYRTVADFALAFCDYDRPYRIAGDRDVEEYGVYNRLNMLRDLSGNLIYPDYDIEIGAEAGFMKSKPQIFDALTNLAGQGRFEPSPGNLTFLKIIDKLGVPNLRDVIDQMEQDILQQQQQQQMQMQQQAMQAQQQMGQGGGMDIQAIIQQLPPEQQQQFMQLPPEEQQAMLQQVMGGG